MGILALLLLILGSALPVDPERADFRVRTGSPALDLGFLNSPMDSYGVVSPGVARARSDPQDLAPHPASATETASGAPTRLARRDAEKHLRIG